MERYPGRFAALGAERTMWGSDFPPVCLHETCEMALEMPRKWDFLSAEDLAWILGKTALKILKF